MALIKNDGRYQKRSSKNGATIAIEAGQPGAEEPISPALLAEIWDRRAQALAETPPAEIEGEMLDLVTFLLGDEKYGLEVGYVREIYPDLPVTSVPRTPAYVVGVFNARGRLISVIDLRAFFGLASRDFADTRKIIVVTSEGSGERGDAMELGILADEVTGILNIRQEDLEPVLATQAGNRAEFTRGITPDMMFVLDLHILLHDERLIVYEEL